jgi:hypothetical protein
MTAVYPAPQFSAPAKGIGRSPQHNKRETAQYIADMVLELRNISKSEGFGTLQGLLEIAYYEAFSVAHKVDLPEGELEHLEALASDVSRA